jgi:ATP-dependent protease HslVU (ClpYQ) peptidase subunit
MTTICYCDGVMASDSMVSCNGSKMYETHKTAKVDGWLVGCAGTSASCAEYLVWFAGLDKSNWPQKAPTTIKVENSDEWPVSCIVVSPKGVIWVADGTGHPYRINNKMVGTGSGGNYAVCALKAGASAVEAVRIACEVDCHSGGKIRVLKL